MIVAGRKYEYVVQPYDDKVIAEVYEIVPVSNTHVEHKILCSETFGKWYRKTDELDWLKAKQWAERQLEMIKKSNQP